MDIFPNDCIYEILLLLNPKYLQLCTQINYNFNQLCRLDSLWRNQIEIKYNELFKKESYENCKLYYQFYALKMKLKFMGNIDNLYKTKDLCLGFRRLTKLPKEIVLLTNLHSLGLSFIQFTQFPKEVVQLTNLRLLELNNNQISQLPKEIGFLSNLELLHLFNNKLEYLPREIGQLTNLQILNLNNNKLKKFPNEIRRLTNLRELRVDEFLLGHIPKTIKQLPNLIIYPNFFNYF